MLAVWLMVTVLPGFSAAAAESAETATAERQIAVEAADERIDREFTRDLSDYLIQSGGVPIAYSVALDDIGVRDVICARIRSALLSRSAQVDVSDYEVNLDFCDYCFCGVINEHPELFYAASYTWSGY